MVTIKENVSNEIIIKNSRFIGLLYKVDSVEDIDSILNELRRKHKDATHICYAYRLDNKEKYSDDGEPSGTAGAPIMDVLIKNNIINVLAVVIRYFGGIKLGAGGLIRAYSKATRETLNSTELKEVIFYNYYELISTYDDLKLLNTLTKDLDIINKEFKENIMYRIKVEKDNDNIEELFNNTNIQIKRIN